MDLQIDQVETSLKFSSFQENNVGDRTQDTGYGTAMDVTQGCSMVSNVLVTRQLNDLNSANIFEPEIELEEDEELQFVEDFHPLSDQVLEYSYRSLVKNYYAGPSHWKYMKKTINKKSQTGQRRIKSKKISIEDLKILDTATENFLIKDKISSKKFSISQKKMKNWLLKKLKLPRNFHVSFLIFDRFSYANFGLDEKVEDFNALRENEFNLEGHFDEDVVMHEQNITTDFSKHDVVFLKPLRDNLKQPRKIDVKAIKEISLAVIRNESEGGNTNVKFSVVDKKVSKMFEQGQTSCALNFLVLLQATNDEKIELVQIDDNIFDFDIKYRFES